VTRRATLGDLFQSRPPEHGTPYRTSSQQRLKACPHCRRKVRLSPNFAVVSPFSATDSLTFLRQCGQALTLQRSLPRKALSTLPSQKTATVAQRRFLRQSTFSATDCHLTIVASVDRLYKTYLFSRSFCQWEHTSCTHSCWCSGSASDSWSKGRWFDSRTGCYQVN